MTKEDIACIIQWFAHIEQLATDRKNANGIVMEDVGHLLNTIKVIAKDSREYVERFCQSSLPSNINEAADKSMPEEYGSLEIDIYGGSEAVYSREQMLAMFKAGAEWMREQGETYTTHVEDASNDEERFPAIFVPVDSFKPGDKVVVQIRKKY